ncbi:MAG: hypothetical protein AAFR98_03745 [Pseudomonadota bacterium]
MKSQTKSILSAIHVALFATFTLPPSTALATTECEARPPSFHGGGAGYEVIDFWNGQVWATRDWTPEEFADFRFPLRNTFWKKNGPRHAMAASAEFLKSPGCIEGEYRYLNAFDREFVQVVSLKKFVSYGSGGNALRGTTLEKYHRLNFTKGQSIRVLQAPDGRSFVEVTQGEKAPNSPTPLPEGWELTEVTFLTDSSIELFGEIEVLRDKQGTSFQGPFVTRTD